MSAAPFSQRLLKWFDVHGRHDLPWQEPRTPYRVWLAEIMLQQTQVAAVIPYFQRFVARFPDLASLAAAPADDVLQNWAGLGYYARARNLQRAAQLIVSEQGGEFPRDIEALTALPGIGRSTAAAILAQAYGQRHAILDGNVKRVLTRVLAFDGDLAEARHERALWVEATHLLPERDIERYTQGLMDLGATLCTQRTPSCLLCPVHAACEAAKAGTQTRYPIKTRKLKRSRREHVWLWLQWRDQAWLVQRPATGVWAGLWSLPEFDSHAAFDTACADWPGHGELLPTFTHTLTHLDWTLHPVRWALPPRTSAAAVSRITAVWPEGRWFSLDAALAAGLPAPLRKLLAT